MCSSSTARNTPLLIPSDAPSLLPRRRTTTTLSFTPSTSILFNLKNKSHLFSSIADSNHLDLSWFSPDHNSIQDEFGGWSVVDTPLPHRNKKKGLGLSSFVVGGVGSSLAVLLAIAYFTSSRKGFRFQLRNPLCALHGVLSWSESKTQTVDSSAVSDENNIVSQTESEGIVDAADERVTSEKAERVFISVAADSTQQEALRVLKKLKIIEDNVKADELCSRREYARWLFRINSYLERNPKHRIVPSVSFSGSVVTAFDDVGVEDQDFEYIQALAEAGIIPSMLSSKKSGSNDLNGQGGITFSPESYISRLDLINWKAQVEYELNPAFMREISRKTVDYMDVKDISSDVSPELYIDMLVGDKGVLRKVFGQIKRFQPNSPSTKAQAAVALTSGRMAEALATELSRIEAETSARQNETREIISQLLDKGEITRFWDEKLHEERTRALETEAFYLSAIHELEQEKVAQEKWFNNLLKEKAGMDCQKQLLLGLKKEVDEMSEKLGSEKAMNMTEQSKLKDFLGELQSRKESLFDTKSIVEAEVEALRILRSWIEDEARKSQARAKVLEEVGRRWKWDDQA